jgi:hypothetical protein
VRDRHLSVCIFLSKNQKIINIISAI